MSIFTTVSKSLRKKGLVALIVAAAQLAVSFSPLAIAPAANAVTTPFTCSANFYQASSGTMYQYDASTNSYAQMPGADTGLGSLNPIGYNPADNYIYGVGGANTLYKIYSDGSHSGAITSTGTAMKTTAGDFVGNDYFLTADSSGNFVLVNTSGGTAVGSTFTDTGVTWAAFDMAYNPNNNQIYGLNGQTLYTGLINFTAGVPTSVTISTKTVSTSVDSSSYGAAYVDSAGNAYFFNNTSKNLWQINSTQLAAASPTASLITNGAVTGSMNDGASCNTASSPLAPIAVTNAATAVLNTSATLNGSISTQARSGSNVTANNLQFCYSTSASVTNGVLSSPISCTNSTPSTQAVNLLAQAVTLNITGLSPGTTYYFQVQATDANGLQGLGTVLSFATSGGGSSSYTVTFNNNGGSGTMTAQSASSATNLTANTFTNAGYTFGGWSTTANGSLAYANSASYPFSSSTTLYAIWTANAPAAPTLPAAPTITVPAGTTIGTAPTTLTPSINAPGGIASRCLVDPADNVCKQTVTIPGKGTFVLNSNGTVTFTAVLGWTGTATVQYRVTDASGQSAEAPVTVTVVAPAAPTVTGGTGTTITTVPANVTPQVSGLGSICLIDPADNVCKQTVTIPGKGTFVLNSNGTVTFTAVAGFIGTVTVQLQITTAYGQVARGPVTFIVGPTSQLQTGATTGTTPVNLAPSTKPEAGSACLVDPSDSGCKNVVTVPSVGTWNLNPSTGAVTFKAVEGYVGTTIVQYRVTRAGFDPTLTPFVVTVAKKRPPVTVTIGGFNPGSPILTTEIKRQIAAFMKAYVGYKTIECIGFTMGPSVLKVDKWLSTTRASNSCDYILKTLKSKVTALPLKNKMETVVGSLVRRITLTLRD